MSRIDNLKILVKTANVIETLKANLAKHVETYNEAIQAYNLKIVELLEEKVKYGEVMLENGTLRGITVDDIVEEVRDMPVSYEKSYVEAIDIISSFHIGDEIELDGKQAKTFLKDEWDWTSVFNYRSSKFNS